MPDPTSIPLLQVQAHLALACGALSISGETLLKLLEVTGELSPELSTDVGFTQLALTVPVADSEHVLAALGAPALASGTAIRVTEPDDGPARIDVRLPQVPPSVRDQVRSLLTDLGDPKVTAAWIRLGGGAVLDLSLPEGAVALLCEAVGASPAQAKWHQGLFDGLSPNRDVGVRLWIEDGLVAASWRYADIHAETGARLVAQFGDPAEVAKLAALTEAGRSGEFIDLELIASEGDIPAMHFHARPHSLPT